MRRTLAVLVPLTALILGCGQTPKPAVGSGTDPAAQTASPQESAHPAPGKVGEAPPAAIVTEEPTPSRPVTVGAELRPGKVRPGETVTLVVQARVAPGWHIYGAEGAAGIGLPTRLRLTLPSGAVAVGRWEYPPATPAGGQARYEGTATFRQQIRVEPGTSPGPLEVSCEFDYQACDALTCRPPKTLTVSAAAVVAAKQE